VDTLPMSEGQKIEHGENALIDARAVGQAHNQRTRAEAELGQMGYRVQGLIVTHPPHRKDHDQKALMLGSRSKRSPATWAA
jgi:hypothetical protein